MNLAKNKWIPLTILLVLIVFVFVYLFIFNSNDETERFASEPIAGCVVMNDRGHYEDSVDVVFLAENYNDMGKFVSDSETFRDGFLDVFPYSEYSERFNFFRLESFENLGCEYDGEYEGAVVCDPATVKKKSLSCPADYYIVLVDINGVRNFFDHLRSSAWRGVASLNVADDPLVFPHEFAHLFADLHDEYAWEGGSIFGESPNCDDEFASCPQFEEVRGSECHIGCVNNRHARSVDIGIMRDYWKSSTYGVFNEYLIENVILENSLGNSEIGTVSMSPKRLLAQVPEEVLLIEYECIGADCKISSVLETEGFVQKYIDTLAKDSVMSLDLNDGESYNFDYLNTLYVEGHNVNGEMVADHRIVSKINDFVIVRNPMNDVKIELKDPEGEVLDTYDYVFTSNVPDYVQSLNSQTVEIEDVV
jgi:hypothetical protein